MTAHDKSTETEVEAKLQVFQMRPKCGGPWLLCLHSIDVAAMLDEADTGSTYEVKVVEMTDAEIEKAGEFNGW